MVVEVYHGTKCGMICDRKRSRTLLGKGRGKTKSYSAREESDLKCWKRGGMVTSLDPKFETVTLCCVLA